MSVRGSRSLIIAIVTLSFITACNSESTIEASIPEGFTEISKDEIGKDEVYIIQHDVTGCYYTLVDGFQSVALTQMYIEKWQENIPYCESTK